MPTIQLPPFDASARATLWTEQRLQTALERAAGNVFLQQNSLTFDYSQDSGFTSLVQQSLINVRARLIGLGYTVSVDPVNKLVTLGWNNGTGGGG